jgi:thiol:disulfide interchange protein
VVLMLGKDWGATLSQIKSLAFFPYDEGGIEYAAPQTLSRTKDSLQLTVKAGYQPPKTGPVRGVLLATEDSGGTTVAVPMEISAVLAAPAVKSAAGTVVPDTPGIASLILFAILGGLILNLMPCVFPVLSIKAIGLVEQAKKEPAAVRAKGLVFAAGVIASMLSLAVVLWRCARAGRKSAGDFSCSRRCSSP